MNIRKGDKVRVITGKDKGREGKVEKTYATSGKVLIQGVNIYKRHVKKNDQMPKGGIVDVPRPIDAAKLMIVCPKCGKTTRAGYIFDKKGKTRICRKCESKL